MTKQVKIILFSCLYILGIIAFFAYCILPVSFIILITLSYLYFYKKLFSFKYLSIGLIIFVFGIFNSDFNLKHHDDLSSYSDSYLTATVRVLSIPSNNFKDKTKFYAKVNSIETDDEIKENIKAKSLITITDSSKKIKNIKIGDTLKLYGKIKSPAQAQNPSQFNYAKYLQHKKTFSLMYVSDNWEIKNHAEDYTGKILSRLNDKRNNIIKIHAQNIKSPMLEILGGIIFGDDAVNPDEETKTSFINSGIFHILAASGMNVTLIFGIWFFFAKNLQLNYKFSISTGIFLILFYTCMTGFGPPIIRAVLMLTLILIGKLIDRTSDTISLLFIVAFLMLAVNPLMLFDIGFQLSFIVTFALILTAPLLTFNFKFKPLNYILGACLIPVIAQLYAAPLQMYYFNTFTIYSVLANIAIIPVLSIVSFIGFISSILALIPAIAVKICYISDFILNPFLTYIVKVAELFSNLPFSIIYLKKPMLLQIILYFVIIVSLSIILRNKVKSKNTYIIIISMFIILLLTFIPIPNKNAEIIFFSVGNADAALIKSPDSKYFLIDTARLAYKNSSSSAKNIIIKYLKDKGIKKLNALILTHFDADHAGGAIDILENLTVSDIYLTDVYENTQLSDNILKYIKDNNISAINVENIVNLYDFNEFKINIIKPHGENILNENQKSLIVHVKNKNNNILFMGDGDIESYNSLPGEFKENITVMKSGHHGAQNTISKKMTENTGLFIISTGINPYNHPNPDTLKIIIENNKLYLRTDQNNAIKVILNNNKTPQVYMYSPKYNKFLK